MKFFTLDCCVNSRLKYENIPRRPSYGVCIYIHVIININNIVINS